MTNLHNEFRVKLPIKDAWNLLTDLPQVARCLPGASLDEVVDGQYRGGLATKIGPVTARYRGAATFRERDDVSHRAVIEARGREEKGSGSASALITLVLKPEDTGTLVDIVTELSISGRAAQFGRSLMAEVSTTVLAEFVRRLETMISQGAGTDQVGPARSVGRNSPADTAAGQHAEDAGEDSLDAVRVILIPLLRKAIVPVMAALGGLAVGALVARRGRGMKRGAMALPHGYVLPYSETYPAELRS